MKPDTNSIAIQAGLIIRMPVGCKAARDDLVLEIAYELEEIGSHFCGSADTSVRLAGEKVAMLSCLVMSAVQDEVDTVEDMRARFQINAPTSLAVEVAS